MLLDTLIYQGILTEWKQHHTQDSLITQTVPDNELFKGSFSPILP